MMFKGHTLRLTCLGLFAVLLTCGATRLYAQSESSSAYRVLILDNLPLARVQDAKKWLDGLQLPAPVYVSGENGQFRITYGDFTSKGQAETARGDILNKEGIRSVGVITEKKAAAPARAVASAKEVLTIYVRDFKDRAQAEALKAKLEPDYSSVMIRQVGNFYEVLVGQYDVREAEIAVGQLRKSGYTTATVRPLPPATQPAAQEIIVAPVQPDPGTGIEEKMLPITQTDAWKKLSEGEKRKVASNVALQAEIRKGDPLASQMFDISKRIESLDSRVKKIVEDYESEKTTLQKRRQEINSLTEEAENLIKVGEKLKLQDAQAKLKAALDLDKENVFGQRNIIQRRIEVVSSLLNDEEYPGSAKAVAKKVTRLRDSANQLARSSDPIVLGQAISLLNQIVELDPKQKDAVTPQINQIQRTLTSQRENDNQTAEKEKTQLQQILMGLAGGLGVLLIMVLFFAMRTRKRHMELMRKVQEITSIRPMRELEGTGPQLLGGSDSDIFSPMAPGAEGSVDPLGGVLTPPPAPDKKAKGKKGKAVPAAAPVAAVANDGLDDIFGGGDMSSGSPAGGDAGLDDIFGAPAPAPAAAPKAAPAPAKAAAPAPAPAPAAATSDIDDIFGGLFAEESNGGKTPAGEPAAAEPPAAAQETGPISFSDFLTTREPSDTTASSSASDDLLTVFDEPNGKPNGQEVDPLQDNPFARMFSDESSRGPAAENSAKDDTEIPSIKLDTTAGSGDTSVPGFTGFDLHDVTPAAGASIAGAESLDLPAFSFDELVGATSINTGNATPGVELDFEQDAAGQPPQGWEGDYPYARLAVEADTPPKGSQQYICFQKQEGTGKAHYSYKFGAVTGVACIEFDLRCNDKNKFLLGFYIEKDGDFQHSIHTKILRSEAQTSPTIHMQGQSAPYLLGSWAHIKYVVDLNEGRVNGYIDSTHVVRDLPLAPNPGMLNTLSIRDNINTTGVLLLDNIKVYEIQ